MTALSLRAQVALVSGSVAALVAVTLGVTFFALLGTTGDTQVDQAVARMDVHVVQRPDGSGLPQHALPSLPEPLPPGFLPPGPPPPESPDPPRFFMARYDAVAPVSGAPGLMVGLRPDRQAADAAVRRSQLTGLGIGLAGVAVAALLGWLLAGYVARPLRKLATAAHRIDTLERLPPLPARGAREVEELSEAVTRMLARLEVAHAETSRALSSARDFAAVCAHELRTPLTSMRTDLEVLATKEVPDAQRSVILSDLLLAERQLELTLSNLERLALGELTDPEAFEPFELSDVLDRAVQDAQRLHPGTRVGLVACPSSVMTGIPAGLMLVVSNAVGNAVQHGGANTVVVTARAEGGGMVEILVDDDGQGMSDKLRAEAFGRFVKGPGSPGSGLGLALILQQAEVHSGTAELDRSPLGGLRLRLRLPVL